MASGLEFVGRLNDSLKSSASTYIKSKSAERADAQKILDSIDKEINYRERLITRYQSSTTRGKQSFGAYSQMYTKLADLQDKAQEQIASDRRKIDDGLEDLKNKTDGYISEARAVSANINKERTEISNGTADPSTIVANIVSRLNKDKVSNEGRLRLFAMLAQDIQSNNYPNSNELLNEIKNQTAIVVKLIDPVGSAGKPDSLDPIIESRIHTPAVTDDFKRGVHNSPVLQRKFLGRSVTASRDYSSILGNLESLMFGDGAEGLSDVQVAQKVVSTIDQSIPNTIAINQQGAVTLVEGADDQDKNQAIKLLRDAGIEPGTTIAEAGRALKVQSGREDLGSLTNEIAELKQRREIAVENLARTPRLSTSKLALLDHPILRVPGFREAIGTVSARRTTPSVIGAQTTDPAGPGFDPDDYAFDGSVEVIDTDAEIMGDDDEDDGKPAQLLSEALDSESGLTAGPDFDPDQLPDYDPSRVSLANRDDSVFRQGGADVVGGKPPLLAEDLKEIAGGVPVIAAVATRIEKSLTDAINQSTQAGVDPVANDRAQANLANIIEDFNQLPENIRRAFPRSFVSALGDMETKGANPEQQIVQIQNALPSLKDVALTGQSVGEYIATVDPNDPDQIEGLGNLLEFVDNPEALGDRASVLVGMEQARPKRDSKGYFGLSPLGTDILGGVGKRLRNALEDDTDPTVSNRIKSLITRAQKLSAENDFYDTPGAYGNNRFFDILEEEPVAKPAEPAPAPTPEPAPTPAPAPAPTPAPAPPPTGENVVEIDGEFVDLSPSMAPPPTPAAAPEPASTPAKKPDPPPVATEEKGFTSIRNLTPEQIKVVNTTLDFADKNPDKADAAIGSLSNALNVPIEDLKNFRNNPPTMGNPASPKMTDAEIKASLMRSINTLAEGADDPTPTQRERNIDILSEGADDPKPTLTVRPTISNVINRPFFLDPRDHPILDDKHGHKGIDLAAEEGDPVRLIASGTVSSVKRDPMGSAGIKIEVDHPGGTRTKYFHGSGIPENIQVGDQLDAGATIMFAGSSGVYTSGPKKGQRSSTGPHLHFEVGKMEGGQFVQMDPEDVFPEIFGQYRRKGEDQGNPSDEDVLMRSM